jgi:hypothetical protein
MCGTEPSWLKINAALEKISSAIGPEQALGYLGRQFPIRPARFPAFQ